MNSSTMPPPGRNVNLPYSSSFSTAWFAKIAARRPTGIRIFSVLLALSTTLFVLVTTAPNGIALTPDSVGYVSAARSLSSGMGVTLYDSSPLTIQAPLYPALLSVTELLTGLDPVESARYVNAGLFGLVVYLSGLLFQRRLARTSLVVVGLAAVSASPVLFDVSTFALTEPLFVVWTLVFLLLIDNYLNENSLKLLMPIAIVTSLATLTRYFGVSLAVTGAAAILSLQSMSFRSKMIHLIWFGSVSVAPLGVWGFRNFLQDSTLFGGRDPSPYPLHHNLYFALIRILSWFVPLDYLAQNLKYTKAHFVLGAMAGYIVGLVWTPRFVWTQLRPAISRIGPEMLFAGIYSTLLIAVSTITAHEGIHDRLMSPIYVPAVLIFLYFLEGRLTEPEDFFSFRKYDFRGRLTMWKLAYPILTVWLAILLLRTTFAASQLMQTGLGYNHIDWRTSETVSYLRTHILPGITDITILSNDPEAVYFLSGVSVSTSPEATGYRSSEPRKPVASIAGKWPGSQTTVLVWFHKTERAHLFEVRELEQIADLTVVRALKDGTIYEVTNK